MHGIADKRDRMARVPGDQFSRDQHERCNNCCAQNSCHALHREMDMLVGAQAVSVTVAMLVAGVIVAVGMDVHVWILLAGSLCAQPRPGICDSTTPLGGRLSGNERPRRNSIDLTRRHRLPLQQFPSLRNCNGAKAGRCQFAPAMTHHVAKLVFWGVRGSTPTLERDTWRYGGNTPCLELTAPDGTHFILDCGTGMRMLGNRWTRSHAGNGIEAHILVTHYHWDHIQGIPFFNPFFQSQNRFHFYSFQSKYLGPDSLRQVLEAQLASPYFPVDVNMMTAGREFHEINGGDKWSVNGTQISCAWLNHPQGCLGYRIETSGGSVVYATDNEPGVPQNDQNLRQLAQGADVLIYDSQYSPEQLASERKGWGHSSWLEGVKIARDAKVRNL